MTIKHSNLKILHVTNHSVLPKSPGYYGIPFKITNGLIRNGHNVLPFGDRDLARYLNVFKTRRFGRRKVNDLLIKVAQEFVPDVVLLGHADMINSETLVEIRKKNKHVKIAQWNADPLFEEDNVSRINKKIEFVDATFSTTAGTSLEKLSKGKYRTYFFANPADKGIERHQNFKKSKQTIMFDFGMAIGNPKSIRYTAGKNFVVKELLDEISLSNPEMKISYPGYTSPKITGREYDDFLSNTMMTLNFSRRNDDYLYSSDRIAHTIGNGILTFVDRATGMEHFFDEDEIPFYSTKEELLEKITYYGCSDSDRMKIAEISWKKYHKLFNSTLVAKKIIDDLYDE